MEGKVSWNAIFSNLPATEQDFLAEFPIVRICKKRCACSLFKQIRVVQYREMDFQVNVLILFISTAMHVEVKVHVNGV